MGHEFPRPVGGNSGTQRWESLLFMHWEVPVEALRSVVPASLSVDTWNGKAYVGVVPFKMKKIRPQWLPSALALNFLETNVRTYVVHDDRPGVYFISLDASSKLAVWAARKGWSLPYHYARMTESSQGDAICYDSQRPDGAGHRVSFRVGEELGPSAPGTLEHFLLERYFLFVEKKGRVFAGQVDHVPYHAHLAEVDDVSDSLVAAAGLPGVEGSPELAHYCHGVDVEVFGIRPA